MLDWDDIRVFLAVTRAGSVSGAAKRLAVQHSTVSRRLRAFEEGLGVRLFDRKRGGYTLTPAGEELAGVAARMEREALSIDGSVLGRDTHLQGTLRVSTADAMATTFLMPIMDGFVQAHPEVDLRLMVSSILLQRETGGNLIEILESIAGTIRARFLFEAKVKAMTSEARFSGYILGGLPLVVGFVISLSNPTYLVPLTEDPLGNFLLLYAASSYSLGTFIMSDISKVEV